MADPTKERPSPSAAHRDGSVAPPVPDHKMIRRIGGGSYGEVWLARSVIGSYRAVKIVYRDRFDNERPFLREFNGIQKFEPISRSHDSQVDILQVGKREGYFYYVMELADDASLDEGGSSADPGVLTQPASSQPAAPGIRDPATYTPKTLGRELYRRGKLSVEECLRVSLSLTTALENLHRHGLVHRDIKPSNIIFVNNVPKLADIGLVTSIDASVSHVGTEGFLPPEGAGTPQGDLYSLGKVLYEMSTGRDRQDFPELPSNLAEMPDRQGLLELNAIISKACQQDPGNRYQSATEMHADIVLLLSGKSVRRVRSLERRVKVLTRSGALLIAIMVLGVIPYYVAIQEARRAGREAERARAAEAKADGELLNSRLAQAQADAQRHVARQRAYSSDMILAQHAIAANNFGLAQELLNHERPEPGQEDLRQWEWRYLWQYCQSDALCELCKQSNWITSLTVSSDGKWLAVGEGRDGGLSVWDLGTRREVARLKAGNYEVFSVFSPREPLLAYSTITWLPPTNSQFSIRFWDAETKWTVGKELPLTGYCRGICFSDDGRTLSTFTMDDQVTLWRVPEGTRLATFPAHLQQGMDPPLPVTMTSDAHLAAYAAPDGWLGVLDLVTGQERWTAKAADEYVWGLAISPDGKRIASLGTSAGAALRLWDVALGTEIAHAEEHMRGGLGGVVFWSDGRRMAAIHASQSIQLWDLRDGAGILPLGRPLRGHRGEIFCLALLPDQSTLASGGKDGSVWLWDATTNRVDRMQVTLPVLVSAWRFGPDSRSILALDQHGHAARWQGDHFQDAQPLFNVGTNILQANFSGDGRLLAVAPTNGLIQVWDVPRGTLLGQFTSFTSRSTFNSPGLLFFAKGKRLLTIDPESTLHEWDLTNWQETQSWHGPAGAMAVAVSPDEARCITLGRSGNLCPGSFHDLATGGELRIELNLNNVEDVAFSPDGQLIAAASSFAGAKLWRTPTLQETAALPDFLDAAFSVCFSPNGSRLAVGGSGAEAITLWDVESRQKVLALGGEGSMFCPAAFSPDGNTLGSVSAKGLLHLWTAPSWEEIAVAEAENGRKSK